IGAPVADVDGAGIAVVAARGPARQLRIGRAGGAGAVAALRRVALIHRRPTLGAQGRHTVRWAVGTRPVAGLGHVAGARGRAAHGADRLLGLGRAGRARAVAALGRIAGPRRRPAHRARVARRVLAGIGAAVALIERARIAVVGARGPTRLLRIRRTRGTRARAGLRQVAHAGRRAAHGAGGLEGIERTRRARPVAGLGDVADAGRGATHGARRRLRIGRTGRSAPGAELRRVADAGRGPALHRRGLEGIGGAVVGGAVAALRRVAGARRRTALRRALRIRRTGDTRPGARFGQVAHARCGPAHGVGGHQGIGGTVIRHPVAALRDVARTRCRAAFRRALRIGRTGGGEPVAELRQVAGTRRVPTQRAGIPGRVLARIAAPVTDVHRAGIEILRARAARRHLRIGRAVGAGAVAALGGVALI